MYPIRKCVIAIALSCAGAVHVAAHAIEPIPETPGWGGFFTAGVGYIELRSNFVAGNGLIDIGDPTFRSLDSGPRRDGSFAPLITGELNYSFGGGWQAFFGTSLEDAVTLDGVTQFGARKDLGAGGVFQAAYLFGGIPSETWEDPYAEGVVRKRTDRDSAGFRLQWDRIMSTGLELTFTYRDLSIDNERSGSGVTSVACDVLCRNLLRRDGEQYTIDASYLFRLGAAGNHLVQPRIRYRRESRDGRALAGDFYSLQLSHVYVSQRYTLASNVSYGELRRNAINPLVRVRTDADRYLIGTTLLYRLPAIGRGWQAVAGVLWGVDDSISRFHDNEAFLVNVGMLYRFGIR